MARQGAKVSHPYPWQVGDMGKNQEMWMENNRIGFLKKEIGTIQVINKVKTIIYQFHGKKKKTLVISLVNDFLCNNHLLCRRASYQITALITG